MEPDPEIQRWEIGRVDRTREHFELRYGFLQDSGERKWTLVAVVGRPGAGIAKAEFLVKARDALSANAASHAAKEIQHYLIDKKKRHPWAYAQYHCGTFANFYSNVHWRFRRPEGPALRPQDPEHKPEERNRPQTAARLPFPT
jgi:hypothetical protein